MGSLCTQETRKRVHNLSSHPSTAHSSPSSPSRASASPSSPSSPSPARVSPPRLTYFPLCTIIIALAAAGEPAPRLSPRPQTTPSPPRSASPSRSSLLMYMSLGHRRPHRRPVSFSSNATRKTEPSSPRFRTRPLPNPALTPSSSPSTSGSTLATRRRASLQLVPTHLGQLVGRRHAVVKHEFRRCRCPLLLHLPAQPGQRDPPRRRPRHALLVPPHVEPPHAAHRLHFYLAHAPRRQDRPVHHRRERRDHARPRNS